MTQAGQAPAIGAERVQWGFYPSVWGYGRVLVRYSHAPEDPVVCFAPPGVSLRGELGLDVAAWRRARWPSEAAFIVGDPPSSVAEIPIGDACCDIPGDFHRWALRESAAHLERLRAFGRRRHGTIEIGSAADRLDEQLEAAFPEALGCYYDECHRDRSLYEGAPTLAAAPDVESAADDPNRIALRSMSRRDVVRFVRAALVLGFAYGVYRLLRTPVSTPAGPDPAHSSSHALLKPVLVAYGFAHLAITAVFLVWVYFRRNTAFEFVRNAFLLACTMAAVPYMLFFNPGYSGDPTVHVPVVAIPTMPALHLAAALTVGISAVLLARSAVLRTLGLTYPAVVLALLYTTEPKRLPETIVLAVFAPALAWTIAVLGGSAVRRGVRPTALAVRGHLAALAPGHDAHRYAVSRGEPSDPRHASIGERSDHRHTSRAV